MPLDRAHMTTPSRVMLPTYVVLFAVLGANYALAARPRLFSSPMLRYADHLMPIRVWGCVFLACALIMATALAKKHRYLFRYGLMVCFMSMAVWTIVAFVGIFVEPVSFSAWVWPATVASACWASNKSLEQDNPRSVV